MSKLFAGLTRSELMSRIRSRGNAATELALAKLFRQHQITGWRRQVRIAVESRGSRVEGKTRPGSRPSTLVPRLAVRPDFVFRKSRTAIFVDGCFWHGCPKHGTQPKGHAAFWRNKLARNRLRDRLVSRTLRRANWRVLRIWEHELARKNEVRLLHRLERALRQNSR